jgi:SOS-response transcriptional repressor LexA
MQVLDFDFDEVRIVGSVPCGAPKDFFDDIRLEEKEHLYKYAGLHKNKTYLVTVSGESMSGIGYHHGDILFVDTREDDTEKANGKVVLVIVNGCMTVKRLRITGNGEKRRIELHSENPRYAPIKISEGDDFYVHGVVKYHMKGGDF